MTNYTLFQGNKLVIWQNGDSFILSPVVFFISNRRYHYILFVFIVDARFVVIFIIIRRFIYVQHLSVIYLRKTK